MGLAIYALRHTISKLAYWLTKGNRFSPYFLFTIDMYSNVRFQALLLESAKFPVEASTFLRHQQR